MLSRMLSISCGGTSARMEASTRSQSRAVSSMRVPLLARTCRMNWPLSLAGKKFWPSHGTSRKAARQAHKKAWNKHASRRTRLREQTLIDEPKLLESAFKA